MSLLAILATIAIVIIGIIFLICYYVLLVQAIHQMLCRDVNSVLLFFSFLSLIPMPPCIIMGIIILIIWGKYKKTQTEKTS